MFAQTSVETRGSARLVVRVGSAHAMYLGGASAESYFAIEAVYDRHRALLPQERVDALLTEEGLEWLVVCRRDNLAHGVVLVTMWEPDSDAVYVVFGRLDPTLEAEFAECG